ncbi:MAG: replication-relaxation family protein [Streptosporangiaceae bacterium]
MIGQHRVLTTGQLCALGFDNVITARHRLGVLVRIAVLRRFRPRREVGSAPWHYLLGPVGAALLGAEDREDTRPHTGPGGRRVPL